MSCSAVDTCASFTLHALREVPSLGDKLFHRSDHGGCWHLFPDERLNWCGSKLIGGRDGKQGQIRQGAIWWAPLIAALVVLVSRASNSLWMW
ncbi:MAG: hypothetical protein QG671_3243 [Actinomycetota bacterium]|nr:hypothetical protein [Actinomycetota bacterium]